MKLATAFAVNFETASGGRKLPPACIARRWGSVDATEAFLLKVSGSSGQSQAKIHEVFLSVFRSSSRGRKNDGTAVDELALDEQTAYIAR